MDKSTYIEKMEAILHDTTKFTRLGYAHEHDRTIAIEKQIQKKLLTAKRHGHISQHIYGQDHLVHSAPGCTAYPKYTRTLSHSDRFFLLINELQHKLSQWMDAQLHPVFAACSEYIVKD